VENLVGFVKSSFFKVRRFHDAEDLRQQLRAWHEEVNQERPCRATGIIPALRLAEEAPRLRALKVQPEQLALRIPVYVGPTGTVLHDGHAYSMPPEAISMPATMYLYGQRVRIVAGRYEAMHPGRFVAHEGSSLAEHRAALVAAVSGKRGKRYLILPFPAARTSVRSGHGLTQRDSTDRAGVAELWLSSRASRTDAEGMEGKPQAGSTADAGG
jgi:hypothetical protein